MLLTLMMFTNMGPHCAASGTLSATESWQEICLRHSEAATAVALSAASRLTCHSSGRLWDIMVHEDTGDGAHSEPSQSTIFCRIRVRKFLLPRECTQNQLIELLITSSSAAMNQQKGGIDALRFCRQNSDTLVILGGQMVVGTGNARKWKRGISLFGPSVGFIE